MLSNNILPIHIWDLPQNGQPIHSVVTIQYETRKYGVLFIAKWVKEYVVMETDKAVQYYLYSNPCVPSEAVCQLARHKVAGITELASLYDWTGKSV